MEQLEKFFRCPSCHEKISVVIDPSVEGAQTYIEDCEVCCRPIELEFEVDDGKLLYFRRTLAYS